ncbi:hypothetical protein BJ165DRAFT_20744 [Panaeolus papilionaceus]|nr:hypothetical protein BJ165DRAFT_20744 [Panaeolus papilionaceus]
MSLFLLPLYISRARSAPLSSIFLGPVVLEDDITGVAATRTLWNIVYTCFTTTFAITWISMHPNIPNKKHPLYPVVLRLLLATYALLIPEAIVFWAAVQWKSAHECLKTIQCQNIDKGEATRKWSITHSFFLLMGGFTVECKGWKKHEYRVLPAHEFIKLVQDDAIVFPDIEAEDLKDKSKGDPLAKGFVILQTLWFVIQILARFAQNLVVTELEVITFALVPLNVATYYFWMHKPLSVKRPIRLVLIQKRNGTHNTFIDSAVEGPSTDTPVKKQNTLSEGSEAGSIAPSGRFGQIWHNFLKMVTFWTSEAYHMLQPGQVASDNKAHENPQVQNNPGTQQTTEPGPKSPQIFSFKAIAIAVTSVVAFTQKWVEGLQGQLAGLTDSSIAFITKSIIGGVIALIIVVFLAVFAILSISPLLFVALGFPCLAILTAPWVASTRAFHAIGTNPDTSPKGESPRLAIFYAPRLEKRPSNIMLGVTVVGATIFGGLHVFAWQFQFPTPVERLLWRISSLALTSLPALYFGCHLLTEYVFPEDEKSKGKSKEGDEKDTSKGKGEQEDKNKNDKKKKNGRVRHFIRFWVLLGIPAYTLARLYVLAEAVVALRDPKPGTLSACYMVQIHSTLLIRMIRPFLPIPLALLAH